MVLATIVSLGALATGCTGDGIGPTAVASAPASTRAATASAASPDVPGTPIPTLPPVRFDEKVAVSGDRELAAKCLGVGGPTILLEAGGTEGSMAEWGTIFPHLLAARTTVCMYSHPGGSGSSPTDDPLTWAQVLADSNAVLDAFRAAGIDGPYLFVGWSFGGEVAMGEALADPSRAAGLVILDTDFPVDFRKVCMDAGRTADDCQAEFDEDYEAKLIEEDLVKTIKPLPDVPITLISAIRPGPECEVGEDGTVTYSVGGRDITATSCDALLQAVADYDLTQWRTLGPQVTQTKVDADHDGLIATAGREIVDIIAAMLADAG